MRAPRVSDERGIALALAVFALVVIGALVAGIFLSGQMEERSGVNTVQAAKAFQAADAGMAQVLGTWDPIVNNGLGTYPAAGATSTGAVTSLTSAGAYYQATITRLNAKLFFVRTHGEQRNAGGTVLAGRDVGMFVGLLQSTFSATSALTARGNVTVKGTSNIIGVNTNPWGDCAPVNDSLAGIRTTGSVSTNGSPTITGSPPYLQNQTIPDSSFTTPWAQLKSMVNKTIPAATTSLSPNPDTTAVTPGVCTKTAVTNWGEPNRGAGSYPKCYSYFPVIYHNGNLKLTNGRGQGILLVDGDLDLAGNFTFDGIIMTSGNFDASHGTNQVNGAVLSQNATLQDITLAGTPTVNYSSCAVSRALQASATVRPLGERGWTQINN